MGMEKLSDSPCRHPDDMDCPASPERYRRAIASAIAECIRVGTSPEPCKAASCSRAARRSDINTRTTGPAREQWRRACARDGAPLTCASCLTVGHPEFLRELQVVDHDALLVDVVSHLGVAREGEVLSQRVVLGAVVGQDAAQVRVLAEHDAVHVVDLTLEPVHAVEDGGE
eukprot:CAMPEP_0179853442 /NCGR_PEP_ID=MMETSP0982-20121206/9360_1 /TAXON_ID=483367 /ORGANISM="non described non described, Strain CCMP 2436" /LENGTH=170 /DNA_ID=CAMNT_0021739177 /DNA_START=185 /DNA_END=698 /DNA_ORIENTATION=+